MTLRTRLLVALGTTLAVALAVAGVLLVTLTRASLVDRLDRELTAVADSTAPIQRMLTAQAADSTGGRNLAVVRLNRAGVVTLALPSGFTDTPDPLPALPAYPGGVPDSALGRITELPSVDGSMRYRVLMVGVRVGATIVLAAPMTGVDAATSALLRVLLLVGAVTMAGLLVLAWVLVRRGLLPLERIAASAERIALGDLSHRAGVPHDATEVGRLGTAFDTMLDRIQGAFTEQQAALEAKERSEDRLRRFAGDASHELRTPITSIRGYADLYRAGGLADPEALRVAMERIGTESRRMGVLVDDLLLLARLDQGRPLRRDLVDLSRICADATTDLRALDPDRPLVAAVEPGVRVSGDDDRLRQVVGNLLGNVRVHAPAGTPVEVVLRVDRDAGSGAAAELLVVDHGPGIPPEHAARVFDRFYRADPGRSRDSGGTGLGLAIVASTASAHGGSIWHEPTPGGGATFGLRLPLAGPGDRPALTAISQPIPGGTPASPPTMSSIRTGPPAGPPIQIGDAS
jgi:two-component system, OmpR family, sensor kinase